MLHYWSDDGVSMTNGCLSIVWIVWTCVITPQKAIYRSTFNGSIKTIKSGNICRHFKLSLRYNMRKMRVYCMCLKCRRHCTHTRTHTNTRSCTHAQTHTFCVRNFLLIFFFLWNEKKGTEWKRKLSIAHFTQDISSWFSYLFLYLFVFTWASSLFSIRFRAFSVLILVFRSLRYLPRKSKSKLQCERFDSLLLQI